MRKLTWLILFLFAAPFASADVIYIGDKREDAPCVFWFTVVDHSGDPVAFTTLGTPKVKRDDGTDCTGTSISITQDDCGTGSHKVVIGLDNNANYAPEHDYVFWLDDTVIDGTTADIAIRQFSIENRYPHVCTIWSYATRTLTALDEDSTTIDLDGTTIGTVTTATTATTVTNTVNAAVTSMGNNVITTASINDGAITNADVADDVDVNTKTITNDAITAAALKTDAVTEIVAATLAGVVDGTVTVDVALKRILAATSGTLAITGADPLTFAYKNAAGTTTVVSHSVPVAAPTGRTATYP